LSIIGALLLVIDWSDAAMLVRMAIGIRENIE
jgi:hypothetical protein